MKPNVDHIKNVIEFEEIYEPQFISIPIPDDFYEMDLNSRIIYIGNELRSLESKFHQDKDKLMRHTSLVRIEGGEFIYSVGYIPIVDNEY